MAWFALVPLASRGRERRADTAAPLLELSSPSTRGRRRGAASRGAMLQALQRLAEALRAGGEGAAQGAVQGGPRDALAPALRRAESARLWRMLRALPAALTAAVYAFLGEVRARSTEELQALARALPAPAPLAAMLELAGAPGAVRAMLATRALRALRVAREAESARAPAGGSAAAAAWGAAVAEAVGEALRAPGGQPQLRELSLCDVELDEAAALSLAAGLRSPGCALETLELGQLTAAERAAQGDSGRLVALKGAGFSAIVAALPDSLGALGARYQLVGDLGAAALAQKLAHPGGALRRSLVRLDLRANCIEAAGGRALALALPGSRICELLLGDNPIGAACAAFGPALASRDCELQRLDLSQCQVTSEAARAVGLALAGNQHLVSLDLSISFAGVDGARGLAHSLARNGTLTELHLRSSGVGVEGCVALAQALVRNSSLLRLDLAGNKVGVQGVTELAAALASAACGLTHLDLQWNGYGGDGTLALLPALQSSATLAELHIGGNTMSREVALQLARLVRSGRLSKSIRVIGIQGHRFGVQCDCGDVCLLDGWTVFRM